MSDTQPDGEPTTSDEVTPRGDDGTNVPGSGSVPEEDRVSERQDAVSDLGRDPGASAEQPPAEPAQAPEPEPAPPAEPEPASAPEPDNQP